MLFASMKVLDASRAHHRDIACIIPHQANLRIIEAIADRLKIPLDRFYINLTTTAIRPPPLWQSRSTKQTAAAGSKKAITS